MGQKIHPLGLRLGISQPHRSKWCMTPKNYPYFILEDRRLRKAVIEISAERQKEAQMNPQKGQRVQQKDKRLGKNTSNQSTRGMGSRGGSTREVDVKKGINTTLKPNANLRNGVKLTPLSGNRKVNQSTLTKNEGGTQKTSRLSSERKLGIKTKTKAKRLNQPTLPQNKLKPKANVQTMFHTSMFRQNLYEDIEISDIFINRRRTLHHYKTDARLDVVEIYVHTTIPVQLIHGTNHKSFIKSVVRFQKALEKAGTAMRPANAPKLRVLLNVFQVQTPEKKADIIAARLIKELEERKSFRQALKKSLKEAQEKNIDGIKIQISGRLNGAEIARTEWVRHGSVPLQTLRANLDYSYQTAKTMYGILGVKVWTFKKS